MLASEVIEKLNRLIREYGDLEVKIFDTDVVDYFDIVDVVYNYNNEEGEEEIKPRLEIVKGEFLTDY